MTDPQDLLSGYAITDQWRLTAALIAFGFVGICYLLISLILHGVFKDLWKERVQRKRRGWWTWPF